MRDFKGFRVVEVQGLIVGFLLPFFVNGVSVWVGRAVTGRPVGHEVAVDGVLCSISCLLQGLRAEKVLHALSHL